MSAIRKYLLFSATIPLLFVLSACGHPGWYGGHHQSRGYYDSHEDQNRQRMDDGYRGYNRSGSSEQYREPVTEKAEAEALVREMILQSRNPNLKTGTVTDKGAFFEVEILTRNDSLVDIMQVDKETGLMRSAY